MTEAGDKKVTQKARPRQLLFAMLVAGGKSNSEAYKIAYQPSNQTTRYLAKHANRVMKLPCVIEELARIRAKSEVKTILSLNERLAILARDAQLPAETPAMVNARARVIEVYSKISGDQAPQRMEVTGKDGQPIATTAQVDATIRVSKRDKIAAILATRATP